MPKTHNQASDWRIGSKRRMIADLAERGMSKRDAYAELRVMVSSQIQPMIFSANVGGRRMPKPIVDQLVELKNEIGRVYAILGRSVSSDFDSEEISPVEEDETPVEETPKPRKKVNVLEDQLREFLRRIRELRTFCEQRAQMSERVDSISMRPAQA